MLRLCSFVSILLLTSVWTACSNPCRELSEKLCACQVTTVARESCERAASAREGTHPPSTADENTCLRLLPGCDCHNLATPEGKVACGLAHE